MGDRRQIAEAMHNLSFLRAIKDDLKAAQAMAEQATQIFDELGDARAVARMHWAMGSLLQFQDRMAEAVPLLESALDRFRELDDLPYVSLTLGSLGWAHMRLGDLDAAMRYGVRSLVGYHALGDVSTTTLTLHGGSIVLGLLGRWEDAAVTEGAFGALTRRYGVRPPVALEQLLYGSKDAVRVAAELRDAPHDAARARGAAMSIDAAVDFFVGIAEELGST